VSSFSAEWLRLREPIDKAARASTGLPQIAGCRFIVDLGAGTGANLRYIAPLLGGQQDWVLIEQDPVLTAAIQECCREWADSCGATVIQNGDELSIQCAAFDCRVSTERIDLSTQLNRLTIPDGALVTASALLDLVSEQWVTELIKRCAQSASPIWFALTYDGRMQCEPQEPEDDTVRSLFNEHQRTNKGFGPALGPTAPEVTRQILAANAYQTLHARSDWRLTPEMRAIQHRLVEGWFEAVRDYTPETARELKGWLERRRAHIDAGFSTLIVGHSDIVGFADADQLALNLCTTAK
jgi:hypothetical protein